MTDQNQVVQSIKGDELVNGGYRHYMKAITKISVVLGTQVYDFSVMPPSRRVVRVGLTGATKIAPTDLRCQGREHNMVIIPALTGTLWHVIANLE